MYRQIEQNIELLQKLCVERKATRLELFGSATGDDFDPEGSDLDFLVEFEEMPPGADARAYLGLLEDLKDLFVLEVDLVETAALKNPFLIDFINKSRVKLYEVTQS